MARKRHKPGEIVAKRRQVEVPTAPDRSIAEAVKRIVVGERTRFRWGHQDRLYRARQPTGERLLRELQQQAGVMRG